MRALMMKHPRFGARDDENTQNRRDAAFRLRSSGWPFRSADKLPLGGQLGASVAAFNPRNARVSKGTSQRCLKFESLPPFHRVQMLYEVRHQPHSEPPDRP